MVTLVASYLFERPTHLIDYITAKRFHDAELDVIVTCLVRD